MEKTPAIKNTKIKNPSSIEENLSFEGGKPPPDGGGTPPGKEGNRLFQGEKIPAGSSMFQLEEEAAEKFNQTFLPIEGEGRKIEKIPENGKSLSGRVKYEPLAPQLTGEAKFIGNQASSSISKDKFYNENQGGALFEKSVKKDYFSSKEKVNKAYLKAEKVYKGKSGIFPKLSKKLAGYLEELEQTLEPNPGEKTVIDKIKNLIRETKNKKKHTSIPLKRLIKTADSLSGLANYEMLYTGPKGRLKAIVKDINMAVLEAAESQGLNTSAMKLLMKCIASMRIYS